MVERNRNVKLIHAYEMLDEIDKEEDLDKKKRLLKYWGEKQPLSAILPLNFIKGLKLDLPAGMPELDLKDMDMSKHPDFMGLISNSLTRLKNCLITVNIPRAKKESIFYEVLINCPMQDAEILCSAKDKALTELYPTITPEFVKSVFPHYVKD